VYALQIDQLEALELAYISGGADLEAGSLIDKFETWLNTEPAPVDTERAQLMTALGVAS